MESILFVIMALVFGCTVLWATYERQERTIARKGYTEYITKSKRWKRKRQQCFKHFYFKCALCGSPHNLQAHHTSYRNLFNEKPGDLVALCAGCHHLAPRSQGLYKKGQS